MVGLDSEMRHLVPRPKRLLKRQRGSAKRRAEVRQWLLERKCVYKQGRGLSNAIFSKDLRQLPDLERT
jgi:hypothetical protein